MPKREKFHKTHITHRFYVINVAFHVACRLVTNLVQSKRLKRQIQYSVIFQESVKEKVHWPMVVQKPLIVIKICKKKTFVYHLFYKHLVVCTTERLNMDL